MPDIIGIDHIYLAVADLGRSEAFYDRVMRVLGFRKSEFSIGSDRHIQYYNRDFGFVIRPGLANNSHNPYAPGLHHLCMRVESEGDVVEAARTLSRNGVAVSEPKYFPEYAPDYVAIFFSDPDGIKLEITNYRAERRVRHDHWEELEP